MISNNLSMLAGIRKEGLSEISRNTGVSRTTLYSLYHEKSKGIQFDTLEKLCTYLNCSIGDFLNLETTKEG